MHEYILTWQITIHDFYKKIKFYDAEWLLRTTLNMQYAYKDFQQKDEVDEDREKNDIYFTQKSKPILNFNCFTEASMHLMHNCDKINVLIK